MPAACASVTLTCQHCGETYERKPAIAARSRYCSKACYLAAHTAPRTTLACQVCGKSFEVVGVRADAARYCSRECASVGDRAPRVTKTCETCGKPFTVLESHARRRRFCSWECTPGVSAEWIGVRRARAAEKAAEKAKYEAEAVATPLVVVELPRRRVTACLHCHTGHLTLDEDGDACCLACGWHQPTHAVRAG